MTKNESVQELKAERVQQELVAAGEPFRISLKAERVQEPSVSAVRPAAQGAAAFALNLELNGMQPVSITLTGKGSSRSETDRSWLPSAVMEAAGHRKENG